MSAEQSECKSSQEAIVYRFTNVEVTTAYTLAKYGFQQLYPISETNRTIFEVTLLFDTRPVRAVINVSPSICPETNVACSVVRGGYWSSCNRIDDSKVRCLIQLIYNVYIRANGRTISDARFATCYAYLYHADNDREWIERLPAASDLQAYQNLHPSLLAPPSNQNCPSSRQPSIGIVSGAGTQQSNQASLRSEQRHGRGSDKGSTSGCKTDATNLNSRKHQVLKRKRPETDEEIAKQLIKNIKLGMIKVKIREEPFDPFDWSDDQGQFSAAPAFVSKLREYQALATSHETFDSGMVESRLLEFMKMCGHGMRMLEADQRALVLAQWWWRYFHWCGETILQLWRKAEPDRSATASRVIHMIVNNLLVTDGIKSLILIAAFAGKSHCSVHLCDGYLFAPEQNYFLSNVTQVSWERQVKISKLVAEELQGNLETPPNRYLMPLAVVSISVVVKLR